MKGFSVVICCYNSAKRIEKTLEHLCNQKFDSGLSFEVIIVNNASTDETVQFCQSYLGKSNLDFCIVDEPTPGLSAARMKGVSQAKYDWLLFCDDDNLLCDTYLMQGEKLLRRDDKIMILGGVGEPLFEAEEPAWFRQFAINFACGLVPGAGEDTFSYVNEVYGAGMFIKRSFFDELERINFRSIISDRKGSSLMSGGDTEYCLLAKYLGHTIAVDTRLTFKHLMPKGRMNLKYLRSLHYGFGRTRLYTQAYMNVFWGVPTTETKLKLPLWKDKLLHKKRELRKFYPKIWFVRTKQSNLDYILRYEALRGEIFELENVREHYLVVLKEIEELKKRINRLNHA